MTEEPDNIVLVMLRDIRSKQDEHSDRLDRVEKQLDRLTKVATYSLGQSTETQFRQSQQESRIDELFDKLEQLLNPKEPA